jgi:hypothetical protein
MSRISSCNNFATFVIIGRSKVEIPPNAGELADWSEERSLYFVKIVAHSVGGD